MTLPTTSRRRFLQVVAAGAAGTLLLPRFHRLFGGLQEPVLVRADEAWEGYYGVDAATHQQNFDRLGGQGYRPVSLSVYGDPADARYAAVWVQRQGPAWIGVHNLAGSDYQGYFDKQTAQGFAPVIVSATGPRDRAVYAAVYEQGVPAPWESHHDMSPDDFVAQNNAAYTNLHYLRSMTIYGTAADRRYAAVWYDNSQEYRRWFWYHGVAEKDVQGIFDTETKIKGYTLSYLALSTDHTYTMVFTDQLLGPWVGRFGMSAADNQKEFDAQKTAGRRPISTQGGGVGNDTHYAAIYAQHDWPTSYELLSDGLSSRPQALSGFDDQMTGFMRRNGIRAAQLSILKDGAVKYAVAFTRREVGSGYQVLRTSDCMRLASCSKIFTEAAVQSLYDLPAGDPNHLTTDTKVYPLLGFSKPKDPRSDTITIQQLLDHTGGYDDTPSGSNFDPTNALIQIAKDMKLTHAATKQDLIQYMYNRPLDYPPGSPSPDSKGPRTDVYSNYGYVLAGAVVEKVTGKRFIDYVRDTLATPMGISEVQLSPTDRAAKPVNEPPYESPNFGPNALDPNGNTQVLSPYGGGGFITEVVDAAGGLAASATAVARFIHVHAVWGNGPRAGGFTRIGSGEGCWSVAVSRGDGVDWVAIFNTREWTSDPGPISDAFTNSINGLLDKTAFS
jgi:CubicO group peptidase (beta-lactamase class C family)